MHRDADLANALLDLLRQPAPVTAADAARVLHPDVVYGRLAQRLHGRGAVLAELQKEPLLSLIHRSGWQAPVAGENGMVLQGRPAPGSRDRTLLFTLRFQDGLISAVLQQFGATVAAPPTPLALTPALTTLINGALAHHYPLAFTYTGTDDQPRLSLRGSIQVFDTTRLAMWVRNADGDLTRSIAARPRVALLLRNEATRATYQFQGRARVVNDTALRRAIYDAAPQVERDHDFAMAGAAVLIDLERIEGYAGMGSAGQMERVLMQRD